MQNNELRQLVMYAIVGCPHSIDDQEITLRFTPKQEGHNALNQITNRFVTLVDDIIKKQGAWQPIDTAPKDETPLLLCCVDWPHSTQLGKPIPIKVGGFGPNGWHVFGASWTPTHWMSLPAAPEIKTGEAR